MIALDTNILVYAHRSDAPWHAPAERTVRELSESGSPWAIPWHCLQEFLAVVTHPRIYDPPTPLETALETVDGWLGSPSLVLLSEHSAFWPQLRVLVSSGSVVGARVHDARIAAMCLVHGVRELWTADRDFGRFPALHARNPLVVARQA